MAETLNAISCITINTHHCVLTSIHAFTGPYPGRRPASLIDRISGRDPSMPSAASGIDADTGGGFGVVAELPDDVAQVCVVFCV